MRACLDELLLSTMSRGERRCLRGYREPMHSLKQESIEEDDLEESPDGSRRLGRDLGGGSATFCIVEYMKGGGINPFPLNDLISRVID